VVVVVVVVTVVVVVVVLMVQYYLMVEDTTYWGITPNAKGLLFHPLISFSSLLLLLHPSLPLSSSSSPPVLLDPVEVVPTDDKGPGHLGRDHHPFEDTTTDRNIRSERAFLVHIGPTLCQLGGLETQTHCLAPSVALYIYIYIYRWGRGGEEEEEEEVRTHVLGESTRGKGGGGTLYYHYYC